MLVVLSWTTQAALHAFLTLANWQRSINILTWLRGFRVKIVTFQSKSAFQENKVRKTRKTDFAFLY